jgi:hypothetical protein
MAIFRLMQNKIFRRKIPELHPTTSSTEEEMPKYVIERDIPNVGSVSPPDVIAISQKSCSVLNNLGPRFSGSTATSRRTKSTVSTSRPTRRWCANTRNRADFRPTASRKSNWIIDPTSAEA